MPSPGDLQYPLNGIQRKINPTSTLGIVTKFNAGQQYRSEEEIENESGILTNILGTDNMLDIDVEMVVKANANIPQTLTELTFSVANAVPNYSSYANGSALNVLIRGPVKDTPLPGKALRITFKGIITATMP